MTQTATKELIQATTFNRVSDKSGVFLGYVVKSDSTENYYHLTFDGQYWHCDCPAYCRRCKHVKALNEHLAARREMKAQEQLTPALTPVHEVMAAAQREMVQFDRDTDPNAYDVLSVTKLKAAMWAAVNSVPMTIQSSKPTCDVCGRETKQAGICGQCGGY